MLEELDLQTELNIRRGGLKCDKTCLLQFIVTVPLKIEKIITHRQPERILGTFDKRKISTYTAYIWQSSERFSFCIVISSTKVDRVYVNFQWGM